MKGQPAVPIGELTSKVKKWAPAKSSDPKRSFTYIDINSVDRDRKEIGQTQAVICEEAPSRAQQLVETGDVLVSTVRPNLNGVALVTKEFDGATSSTGFCVLRPNPRKLHTRYLYHWVCSDAFISKMVARATGASYPAVTDKVVKESTIPLPPIDEQRRIAAILDKADAVRRKRQQAIELADQFLQSAFLEMFGDPLTNPMGWEEVQLGDLLNFLTSGSWGGRRFRVRAG